MQIRLTVSLLSVSYWFYGKLVEKMGWKTSGLLSVSYFSLTTVHMAQESMDVKGIDWFFRRSEENNWVKPKHFSRVHATLQPALSVRWSVVRGLTHFTFSAFLRFLAILLLHKCSADIKYGPCPLARDWGSRVSGLIHSWSRVIRGRVTSL